MLTKISFLRLRNAEVIQFLTQLLVLLTAVDLPALVQETVQSLQRLCDELEALHKEDPASLITEELVALDETRDDLYTGLLGHCRNLDYHNDVGIGADGILLRHTIGVYGDSEKVTRQPYVAESTDIDSLLADLARPDVAAAAARSGATMWITPLKVVNDLFKKRFLDRNDEKVLREFAFTMKNKRSEGTIAYEAVVRKINALYEMEGAEAVKALIDKMNMLGSEYRKLARQRRGRAEAKTESAPRASA
ncbi:DUF6261 family protein [Flaviaesturariibacter aridisoli]|uniref:Uncharacterized protein n=1 Tax=Flaviaesturariibacter aridisoli TaxID=2545761 RepID=A0A4V2WMF0_9BACT|nr:DUF6261 family protein [Flaviaesturariibacter aridisoli]TCZ68587.1 hypothetical protein E0486_13775 [Flaviaesturariibacter aridisoli]